MSDPISDLIIQLKNAGMAGRGSVSVPYSAHKHAVAEKLRKEGYLASVEKRGRKARKTLSIELAMRGKEKEKAPAIADVARVSKPSRRVYEKAQDLSRYNRGRSTLLLSTPRGILTHREALKENVGGEALFTIR